jgi:hypothetical protein
VQGRCHVLENIELSKTPLNKNNRQPNNSADVLFSSDTTKIECPLCSKTHFLNQCKQFIQLTPGKAFEAAKKLNLCINCLRAQHHVKDCTSGACRKCKGKHNTMLHRLEEKSADNNNDNPTTSTKTLHTSADLSKLASYVTTGDQLYCKS